MRLNLNDTIKVKLTEHGKDIYYHQYDRTNAVLGRELCKPSYPLVDDDGYTTFQLWRFMELYGDHMGMTLPNVIEPLDIVFDAPTLPSAQTEPCENASGEDVGDIIRRLKNIANHAVHVPGEKPFVLSLDDGIALFDAAEILSQQIHARKERG